MGVVAPGASFIRFSRDYALAHRNRRTKVKCLAPALQSLLKYVDLQRLLNGARAVVVKAETVGVGFRDH